MNFAERLTELMQTNGITKYRISRDIGCSASTITNWLNGTMPTADKIQQLAEYFDVTVDYLLGNVNDPCFYLDNQRISDEINSLDGYKKEPGQKAEPNNDYEEHILMLARKAEDIPKEQRDRIIQNFADTIDIYLAAKGLKKEDP